MKQPANTLSVEEYAVSRWTDGEFFYSEEGFQVVLLDNGESVLHDSACIGKGRSRRAALVGSERRLTRLLGEVQAMLEKEDG